MSSLLDDAPAIINSGRGGRRVGSGAKPSLEKQLVRAEKVAKELKVGTKLGLHRLANEYDDLMKLAIEIAFGEREVLNEDGSTSSKVIEVLDKKGNFVEAGPNSEMVKFLLNLPVKLVEGDEEAGESRGINKILERVARAGGTINVSQNNYGAGGPTVDGGPGNYTDGTWREPVPGAEGDTTAPEPDDAGGRG